jgi:hypothetical protein
MAVERHAAKHRLIGLPELVATVLRRSLQRDPVVCVSPHWADKELSKVFVDHAVHDVCAALQVHDTLCMLMAPHSISPATSGGTPVTLYSTDGRPVAHGAVALDRPARISGVNVTTTRVPMTVTEVVAPGYLLPASLCGSRKATALSAMGPTPFTIVCAARHMMTRTPETQNTSAEAGPSHISQDTPGLFIDESSLRPGPDAGSIETDEADVQLPVSEQDPAMSQEDPAALAALCKLLLQYSDFDPSLEQMTFSRTLGDPWHLHHQFPISMQHGLRRPFFRALSAAMFIPDASDKAAVERVLQRSGMTFDAELRSNPDWVLRRVRRHMPSPQIMLPRVKAVIKTYGALKDSTSGHPLFNEKAWEVAENVLENIRCGYYSDPPGVQLYYSMGSDKNDLQLYRCCRGTNSVEGGVHQNLIRRFTSMNVSPRHATNLLLDYAVCHNMRVSHSGPCRVMVLTN